MLFYANVVKIARFLFTFVLKAENMSKISIVGIGPGDESSMTPEALAALQQCDVVVGYKYYFNSSRIW